MGSKCLALIAQVVRSFGMSPKVGGFESPSGRDNFCLKNWHFHKNSRSCVENECCCPRTVIYLKTTHTHTNIYIYILSTIYQLANNKRGFAPRDHTIYSIFHLPKLYWTVSGQLSNIGYIGQFQNEATGTLRTRYRRTKAVSMYLMKILSILLHLQEILICFRICWFYSE